MTSKLNLNLLPQDLKVSKGIGRVIKITKSLNVILTVLFLISVIVVISLFVIGRLRLKSVLAEVEQLKVQVKALETSEQQLVLIKDRIAKISYARSYSNAKDNILNTSSLFSNLSNQVAVNSMNITPVKTDVSLTILSNDELTTFMNNLKNIDKFKSIDVYSFEYNKNIGYQVKVNLGSNK